MRLHGLLDCSSEADALILEASVQYFLNTKHVNSEDQALHDLLVFVPLVLLLEVHVLHFPLLILLLPVLQVVHADVVLSK